MQGPSWVALSMRTPMHKQHFCETSVYLAQDVVGIESAWTRCFIVCFVYSSSMCANSACLHGD